jgi:hypothetical protein
LLVSVGTGNSEHARPNLEVDDMHLLHHAKATPGALMISAAAQQDALCRVLGRCRHGDPIDSELGDLMSSNGLLADRLFTYVRYDRALTRSALERMNLDHIDLSDVLPIDAVDRMAELRTIGAALAREQVDPHHFDGFLGG